MKRILLSGALGFVVLVLWTFVANGVFRFANRVEMMEAPHENRVYTALRDSIVEPGAYVVNPQVVPQAGFPAGEPVYGVLYAGFGHEAAGSLVFKDLGIGLAASMLAAVLLSSASTGVRSHFWSRVLFVAAIGVLLALFGDLARFGIGGYPARSALLLAGNTILSWALMGVAMAWLMGAPQEVPDPA